MMLSAGTRLGSYAILGPIGAGGMGEVYRARDTRLGRDVAVKVLPGEVSHTPERLHRFEQEASRRRTSARVPDRKGAGPSGSRVPASCLAWRRPGRGHGAIRGSRVRRAGKEADAPDPTGHVGPRLGGGRRCMGCGGTHVP